MQGQIVTARSPLLVLMVTLCFNVSLPDTFSRTREMYVNNPGSYFHTPDGMCALIVHVCVLMECKVSLYVLSQYILLTAY